MAELNPTDDLSPFDLFKLRQELFNRESEKITPEQRAANRARNAEDLLSVLPISGNVIAAKDMAVNGADAMEQFSQGNYKRAALAALLSGLGGVGAVSGLPTSSAAARAAEGASSRANVLVPFAGKGAADARVMRAEGATNREVFDETGLFFGPEGKVRREISDRDMGVALPDTSKVGQTVPIKEIADHPELYREYPWLAETPIALSDKLVTHQGNLGGVARSRDGISYELTAIPVATPDWHKEQIAKLLQYEISRNTGLPRALNHDLAPMLAQYNTAIGRAKSLVDTVGEPAQAYIDRMMPARERLAKALETKSGMMRTGQKVRNRDAGTGEARVVRSRATMSPEDMQAWGPYPYAKGMPTAESIQTAPFPNLDNEQLAQFLNDWFKYGAGAPGWK